MSKTKGLIPLINGWKDHPSQVEDENILKMIENIFDPSNIPQKKKTLCHG